MNVVGTVLLTSVENPMCPGCDNYPPNVELLRPWLASLRHCSAMVLEDELGRDGWEAANEMAAIPVSFMSVEPTADNLFVQRWIHHRYWLDAAVQTDYVWLTDGTDVRMLNPPWEHMNDHTLYVGSENDTVSNRWILANHPSLREFAAAHPNNRLLNAGLLGGHRDRVLEFLDALIGRGLTQTAAAGDITDMAAFNLELYEGGRMFETGYPIHTRFNDWVQSDPKAYFAHK